MQQIEPTPENIQRVRELYRLNEELQQAITGQAVIQTQERENQLIEAGQAWKQLLEMFNRDQVSQIVGVQV